MTDSTNTNSSTGQRIRIKCEVCGGLNGQHNEIRGQGPPWNPWAWVPSPCPNA